MPEKKLQELKAERGPLYQQLVNNPNKIYLALQIKTIDDQIAECNQLGQLKRRTT